MTELRQNSRRPGSYGLLLVGGVAFAAFVMGLPTVGGGFVGGDDHRLVLNHVLVNHPSLEHALELFTIVHRDLYQPLPLLSFSTEFLIADVFGLFREGVDAGAWLFHLTNALLHTINAALVWAVVFMLQTRVGEGNRFNGPANPTDVQHLDKYAVATAAALLFAVHPVQAEVIAWLNGRMMLMSTLFALMSLLVIGRWLERPRFSLAMLTVLLVLFAGLSKVRIGLPILLLIVPLARRQKLSWRFLWLWAVCGAVTAVLVLVNIRATAGADLFAQGAEHLKGPRLVRVLLALASYFQHLVWPVGLASYYPTPPMVNWLDGSTGYALLIVLPCMCLLGWMCVRLPAARLGVVWFFATLASTLPFVPARNILSADRYLYLPVIGLFWLGSAGVVAWYRRLQPFWPPLARKVSVLTATALLVGSSIAMGWHVESFYATPIKKTTRIATLFPDTARVWEPLGWTLYTAGRYEEAMNAARKELRHDAPSVQSGAYQLIGMCELRQGNGEAALHNLHKAIEVDPRTSVGIYRLGIAYDELGNTSEAVTYFKTAVEKAPQHNPTINRLASVYRRLGRGSEARALYEQAVGNNPYEVPAILGLAELDIEEGTPETLLAAERRLLDLLDWMPENTSALINLGVVHIALGQTGRAVAAYQKALAIEPNNATASLNLAQLHLAGGDIEFARRLFERVAASPPTSVEEAIAVHDFFLSEDQVDRVVSLWEEFGRRFPDSEEVGSFLAWSYALAGSMEKGRALAREHKDLPLSIATIALLDLGEARYLDAVARTGQLGEAGGEVRQRLMGALERFDRHHPEVSWTFCMTALLLLADGNLSAARVSVDLFDKRCTDPACREWVESLRTRLASATTDPP